MKFKAEELLLAAEVRKLVAVRLEQDAPKHLVGQAGDDWRSRNTPEYVTKTVGELEFVAELINRRS